MRRLKALWTRSRGADRRPGHTTRPGWRPAPIGTIDWDGSRRRANTPITDALRDALTRTELG